MSNPIARRALTFGVAVAAATVAAVGPAIADTPNGWSNPSHVNPLHFLAFVLFIPVGVALIISGLVLLPGLLRGEGLLPKGHKASNQPPSSSH